MKWNSTGESVARAAGPEKHLESSHIGLVAAQPHGVNRKSQNLRLFKAESRVIELRQTVTLGGNQPVSRRSIHRPRRMHCGTASPHSVKKIVPVSADPHRTLLHLSLRNHWMRNPSGGSHHVGDFVQSSGAVDCNPACQGKSQHGDFCIDKVTNECDTSDVTAPREVSHPKAHEVRCCPRAAKRRGWYTLKKIPREGTV